MPPPGPIRRERRTAHVKAPTWFDGVLGLVSVGLGVVLPLYRGSEPVTVLVTAVCAVLAGASICFLPDRLRPFGWFVLLLVGALLGSIVVGEEGWYVVWLFTYFLGVLLGMALLHRRQQGRRAAETTEPAGVESSSRMRWDEGADTCDLASPADDDVVAAIRALDGDQRGYVSIMNGAGRLDVAGRADGALMVFQCDDPAHRRATWHHITSPEVDGAEDEVTVPAGGVTGHFPRASTTTLDVALLAARHYLATGERERGLAWFSSRDVAEMRHPVLHETAG